MPLEAGDSSYFLECDLQHSGLKALRSSEADLSPGGEAASCPFQRVQLIQAELENGQQHGGQSGNRAERDSISRTSET